MDTIGKIVTELEYKERQGQRAAVRALPEAIIVEAMSGRGITSPDPSAYHAFLPVSVDDASLGSAVLSALLASRFLNAVEAATLRAEADDRWRGWVSEMLRNTGIGNEGRLFNKMALCHVALNHGIVSLSPTVKRRGAAWEGIGADHRITVAVNAGPAAIARALREAFTLCSPEVRIGVQQQDAADVSASAALRQKRG